MNFVVNSKPFDMVCKSSIFSCTRNLPISFLSHSNFFNRRVFISCLYIRNMSTVDTSIHPHTSGRAAQLAAEHSAANPLILYGGWFCPFVQRAWITLHEKNIPHQYVEINPYKKEKDFLALNPRGLVPTLGVPSSDSKASRKPLIESNIICSYLDEVYPEHQLTPSDAYERAHARIWIDHISTKIVPAFYRFLQHTPAKNDQYTISDSRAEFHKHILTFIKAADPTGPFFLGTEFSLVDVTLAPWVARIFLLDHYKEGGFGAPEDGQGGNDQEAWKRWKTYTDAVLARKSVQETLSEPQQYIDVYKRYAEDKTNSEVGQATRSGRGLP